METKFLLTGSRGFLGGIVKESLSTSGMVMDINDLAGERIDIASHFELPMTFLPDVVVHIAGKAHSIPRTTEEEKAFYAINYDGTKNLCAALENLNQPLKGFVFISTVAVYGLETGTGIDERFPTGGSTPYAKSKIMAEDFLRDWGHSNNIPILILRLPLIAGPKPPGNLGKMVSGINSGRYLSINAGRARRSVVMASDVATCITENIGRSGTFNLTDGLHPSFHELEKVISAQLGKKMPFAIPSFLAKLLGIAGDILPKFPINSDTISKMSNDLTFDDTKARQQLRWNPANVKENFIL